MIYSKGIAKALISLYLLLLGLYSVFSYSLVDVNLHLWSNKAYIGFQQIMWDWIRRYRTSVTLTYFLLILALFVVYGLLVWLFYKRVLKKKELIILLVGSIGILFISYPALSHDIFNYLFNAKMVILYHADPHRQVALDFATDPWLNFMRNVHTPAPYGYGFTILSLIPSYISGLHLQMGIAAYRVWMVLTLFILLWTQRSLLGKQKWVLPIAMFALNPLVMIETVSNVHNDVVMMALVMLAILIVSRKKLVKKNLWRWIIAVALFLMSVSIKLATLMLLPGLVLLYFSKLARKSIDLGTSNALTHFLPLLTPRSQIFLPWYLIWSMSFAVFSKVKEVWAVLWLFSLTGMMSYIPYLYYNEYTATMQSQRMMILFSLPVIYVLYRLIVEGRKWLIK